MSSRINPVNPVMAYHEAGHCAVIEALGHRVTALNLYTCSWVGSPSRIERAAIGLAGMIAVHMKYGALPTETSEVASDSDLEVAETLSQNELHGATELARHFLQDNWRFVEATATFLLESKSLLSQAYDPRPVFSDYASHAINRR